MARAVRELGAWEGDNGVADQIMPPEQGRDVAASPELPRYPEQEEGAMRPDGLTGQRLGDYHLRALLGAGGMADVYRAYDMTLMREVAVKVLASPLADDANYVDRFRTEARRVAALSHPHLVPVYHAGEDKLDGQHLLYLVMPLMHGSLHDLLRQEGKLPYAEAVLLALQVADGLEAAHRVGLVHRDVKPENILLDAEGQALLADFGIAREVRYSGQKSTSAWSGLPDGTPEYMAPEQLRGGPVDQRADIYALGAVLYELLTGKRPFAGETPHDIATQALGAPLIPPAAYEPGIPPALDRAVLRALARDPDERYPSVAEFALALRRAVSHHPADEVDIASAMAVSLPDHVWSSPRPAAPGYGRGRRRARRMLAAALAAALLLASLGGALAALQQRGQSPRGVPDSQGIGPIVQASPTGTGGLLPDETPVATPGATSTPRVRPTSTSAAKATATPRSALSIAPTPLVLTPSSQNTKTCIATQTIRSNRNSTVGWAWQKPTVAGFHFQIDGKPSVGWPTATTDTPPGGQNTLVVTADCKSEPVSYAVLVKDSLGGQYTFVMTLQ
jgi:serine/threonine protein kinase